MHRVPVRAHADTSASLSCTAVAQAAVNAVEEEAAAAAAIEEAAACAGTRHQPQSPR